MKKALLITLEYPPQNGGIARYLHNIYSGCSRDQLVILAPNAKGEDAFDKEQSHKIYRRSMSVWWAWPRWRIIGWYVISLWFRERFREIHISHVLPVGYVAFIFWKIFKIPYVVYTHGMDVLLPQNSRWKKFWLKKILQNAREVVANSNFTKNEVAKLGVSYEKISVQYPCVAMVDPLSYSREWVNGIKKQYNLEGKRIILSVGRLVARKGFDRVIEAMPRILHEVSNTVYVVVGSGPDKDRLCQMSNVKCQMSIIYVDSVSDRDLHIWYELCDLFVMPARQIGGDVEGFGIAFLEAALHGKPSIGGRSGGVPEAIDDGKTGILVDPENVDGIAHALIQLLQDDVLREHLGQAAEMRVKEQFLCPIKKQNTLQQ